MTVLCIFHLVIKQVSTDKLWLHLNNFMGLFQSCGFLRASRPSESILTYQLCLNIFINPFYLTPMKIFRQPESGRNGWRPFNVISVVEFCVASCISLKINGILARLDV